MRTMSVARSTGIWDLLPPIASSRRAAWAGCAIKSSRQVASPSQTSYAPREEARAAFEAGGSSFIVWVDRVRQSRFEDTDRIFVAPERYDLRVVAEGSPEYWAEEVANRVRPVFDTKRPTALFVGRYQPFHDGHRALIIEGLRRVGQVCIAVRDTAGTDGNNPFDFEYVRARIEHALREFEGRFLVVPLPNITHVFYGRDVGYAVERIDLDLTLQAISASDVAPPPVLPRRAPVTVRGEAMTCKNTCRLPCPFT